MNSRRLRHFLAVYEHRSFGRAAEMLHVTQPALSKSVQLLEEEFNIKLFERTATGVVPTVYGESLALHAKAVEAEMHNAAREIAMLSNAIKGEVKVGATPGVAADLVPRTFVALRQSGSSIMLEVIEGLMENHVPALRRGELDVVIGGWIQGTYPDLTTEMLLQEDILVFASSKHPLAGQSDVSLTTLLTYPWVMPLHTQFWLQAFERIFVANGLEPPAPVAVTNSSGFIKTMLLENQYLSALPARLLANELRDGSLVAIPASAVSVMIEITATYRKRDVHLSAFDAFMEALRSVCTGKPIRKRRNTIEQVLARIPSQLL